MWRRISRPVIAVFEHEFSTHRVFRPLSRAFGAVAQWESDGRLTMWSGLQAMFQGRNELHVLSIDPSRITMKSPYVGGGIWAKSAEKFPSDCGYSGTKTGRPVKIVLTREEEQLTTRPRVAPRMHVKLGMMKDGTMVCKESKIIADNGAYSWAAPKVLLNLTMRTDCLYRFKSSKADAYLVYTNLIPTSGFRGYGNSQMHFALESFIDMLQGDRA